MKRVKGHHLGLIKELLSKFFGLMTAYDSGHPEDLKLVSLK